MAVKGFRRSPEVGVPTRLATLSVVACLAVAGAGTPVAAQRGGAGMQAQEEPIDEAAIERIKDEGFNRSQVMEILSWLTDVYGPRLTGSPISKQAGDWTLQEFERWGLANPHYEWWGPFGRGWVNERMVAQVNEPVPFPVIAYPGAWTDGTDGPVTSEVVYVPDSIRTAEAFAPYRGTLKGKIVITQEPREVDPWFDPPGRRYTEDDLNRMANPYPVGGRGGFGGGRRFGRPETPPSGGTPVDLDACFVQEGVAAVLSPGRGDGGNVFVSSGGSRDADAGPAIPRVSLAAEHYGRIFRILDKGIPVEMELDVRNRFYTDELNSFNILAEIPGTDLADEVVMLGGHFDSWHAGTGATDNAAGSAVMMEAMRILKATGLPLRRTVRIGLWTGEEEGLIGSREYVAEHFGDRNTMEVTPEHADFSAYYNVDNGTGAIRGVYLQGNEAVGPIFAQWMRPLNSDSIPIGYIDPGNTGGTDHLSFDAVGLPGFQFIQDPIEYSTRTHHSSQDLYERVQPGDMMHNAVVVATFVYLTANRDEKIPRKPMPEPRTAGAGFGFGGRGGTQQPVGCPVG